MTTATSVARSLDHGGTWAFRAPVGAATRKFSGLVRGADQALYLSNDEAMPLFTSVDEGETWQAVPTRWNTVANLHDFWATWAPSTAYSGLVIVNPTPARTTGLLYRLVMPGTSGATEPSWPLDAGAQIADGTARWTVEAVPGEMRPVSMVSRTCAPGQQRCGSGCVDIASNAQHCGACNQPCATTCLSGRCLQPGTADGGDGLDGCEPLDCSNARSDDLAAIGAGCLGLSGVSLPPSSRDAGACFADRGVVASQCCSMSVATGCPQRGETGVVCSRD